MAFPEARLDAKKSRIDRGKYETAWFQTVATLYGVSRAEIGRDIGNLVLPVEDEKGGGERP
jgi:hypothetical protein